MIPLIFSICASFQLIAIIRKPLNLLYSALDKAFGMLETFDCSWFLGAVVADTPLRAEINRSDIEPKLKVAAWNFERQKSE